MTLTELRTSIDLLVAKGHGGKTVVYSCDAEGNGYEDIHYSPSVMTVKELVDYRGMGKGSVVCIN